MSSSSKTVEYNLENVFYINLASRTDRREKVEEELHKVKWKFERFDAIRHENGRIGCSTSHLRVLELAKSRNLDYVVIVEDDIHFTFPALFNALLDQFLKSKESAEYDVLLLAGNIRPPVELVSKHLLRVRKSWTTTGYIVKKHYYDILIENIREGIEKLSREPEKHHLYAVDSYWMSLQERDRWFILVPRTINQRPDVSDIEGRYTDYTHLMLDSLKKRS
jgi:glycosyl transferase, family 25